MSMDNDDDDDDDDDYVPFPEFQLKCSNAADKLCDNKIFTTILFIIAIGLGITAGLTAVYYLTIGLHNMMVRP